MPNPGRGLRSAGASTFARRRHGLGIPATPLHNECCGEARLPVGHQLRWGSGDTMSQLRLTWQVNSRVQIPGGSGEAGARPLSVAALVLKGGDSTEVPCGAQVVFMVKPVITRGNGPVCAASESTPPLALSQAGSSPPTQRRTHRADPTSCRIHFRSQYPSFRARPGPASARNSCPDSLYSTVLMVSRIQSRCANTSEKSCLLVGKLLQSSWWLSKA